MGIRVGIDLGTTYTKIAYVDNFGNAVGVNNMEGTYMTPSVVFFESPEDIVVGETAKELVYLEPEKAVCGIKRLIGKSNFAINFQGEDLSPEEVAAFIIKKVINDASMLLGEDVDEAVIAVPTYWGINEVMAIRNAGTIAGIDKVSVVTETTAAALAYSVALKEQNQAVLIYDLGGSSFQVAVAAFNGTDIRVICSDGDDELGGRDWDDVIYKYLADEFCNKTGFDGEFDIYAQQDLRLKAEKAKQQLSSREEVPVMLDAAGLRTRIKVSRTTFDEITQALLNKSIEKTDAAIAVAESNGYKVEKILFVGGSTRMPQIAEKVYDKYGIKPEIFEPELAIAKGAALYTLMELNDNLKQVASKSYALRVIVEGEEICQNIIVKNWQFYEGQIKVIKEFGIVDNGLGRINLSFYESDHTEDFYPVDESLKIVTISFDSLNAGLLAVIQLEITLTVNGNLNIYCKNYNNGKQLAEVNFGVNSKLISDITNIK